MAVLAAAEVKYRAPGIFNVYRQESNFFYLTGELLVEESPCISTDWFLFISEQASTNQMH